MFHVGDYLVYKRDVCKVIEIKKNHLNDKDYYVLVPIDDESLIIDVPTDNRCGYIRKLISKEQVKEIIHKIPTIGVIECNDKNIELEYKNLFNSGDHCDLIKIIKTTYLRNKQRLDNNKKIGDKDKTYFQKAEKSLYNEFGIVLGMSADDVKNYIIESVNKLQV